LVFSEHEENSNGLMVLNPRISSGAYVMTIATTDHIEQIKIIRK
jgi:hypothetical protein